MNTTISRRAIIGSMAIAATGAGAGAALAAVPASYPLEAPQETPTERVSRLRRELVDATKSLYPDVSDWRLQRPENPIWADDETFVGHFMIHGRRAKGGRP